MSNLINLNRILMKKLILLFIGLILINSCKVDFDINAEWQDRSIVYCLLNQNDTAHYVRLEKSFLGEADAYEMAQISDSIYYQDAIVRFFKVKNEDIVDTIILTETDEIEKNTIGFNGEPGIFSTENHLLYKTKEILPTDYEYQLNIFLPELDKTLSASTVLMKDLYVRKPSTQVLQTVSFVSTKPYQVEFNSVENGRIYGLTIRINYREFYLDGTYEDKHIDWKQSTKTSSNLNKGVDMIMQISGESFFKIMAGTLEESIEIKREMLGLDFIFVVGTDELNTYIEVNGPSQGIVQEKPAYSNIENGIGIFSAIYDKTIPNKYLSARTLDTLALSDLTKDLRFKDGFGNYPWETK